MVMEDKGMKQRDWCLCACMKLSVLLSVCVCEDLMCASHGGRKTREGLGSSGESVIGREMGNWNSGSMK